MVTGASTAHLAIILIDVRNGVIEQTARHSFIASLLQIPHLVVCVNKMDLVDYSEDAYNKVVEEFTAFAAKLNVSDIRYIPISALFGDNVVDRSKKMDWYEGATLLNTLETVHISSDYNHVDCRFPVQTVIRPHTDEYHDFRGYAGRIAGGVFKKGDEVMVLPSGFKSKIKSIDTFDGEVKEAFAPMSVTITLENDIDISRGDMIVRPNNQPEVGQDIDFMMCWLSNNVPKSRAKYYVKHTSKEVRGMIKNIQYKVDINSLHRDDSGDELRMNEIARVQMRVTAPLCYDSYTRNRLTGSIILIDEATNETVAAGMIL